MIISDTTISGQYYKHKNGASRSIVNLFPGINDDSKAMLQIVASLTNDSRGINYGHDRFMEQATCYINSLTFHKPFLALAKQIQRIRPFFFSVILVVFIQFPSVAMLIGFPFTIYREIILRTSNSLQEVCNDESFVSLSISSSLCRPYLTKNKDTVFGKLELKPPKQQQS